MSALSAESVPVSHDIPGASEREGMMGASLSGPVRGGHAADVVAKAKATGGESGEAVPPGQTEALEQAVHAG